LKALRPNAIKDASQWKTAKFASHAESLFFPSLDGERVVS